MTGNRQPETMRAWMARDYGGPEALALRDIPVPQPGPRDVLVKVEATTVSAACRRIRAMDFPKGMKLIGRAMFGFIRPRRPVLGVELTGIVAAVGRQVTRFAAGDPVIAFPGMRMGGHAEYALIAETGLIVPRPKGMAIETAAALGFGGTTARDFLRRAGLKAGERVLVIGASGTVGSALVQLARDAGAEVTGVTSGGNRELVMGLGATAVIDYTREDINAGTATYDIVADAAGSLTFARALPLLSPGGRYLGIDAGVRDMIARPRQGRRCIAGPASEKVEDLAELTGLAAAGRFRPLIDSVMAFEAMPAAHARADTGRKRGSVVIRL